MEGKIIYEFTRGASAPKGVSAQAIGEVLERLEEKDEMLPKAIVDVARPESSPIHPCFEWDDPTAAELYRQEQARYLTRIVVSRNLADTTGCKQNEPVRVFHSLRIGHEPSTPYRSIVKIMRNDDMRKTLLRKAIGEARAYKAKYNALAELSRLFTEIDALDQIPIDNTGN